MDLRPYQQEGLTAICRGLLDHHTYRQLLKMPTGTGKTVLFAELLKRLQAWLSFHPKLGASMLVIAHREELLDQAADKIRKQNPGLIVDIEQGPRRSSRYADVIIASIQTLAARQFSRLEMLLARHTFRIVVVDEAHHAAADTYRTALARLGFLPMADVSGKDEIEAATYDDVRLMEQALEGWDQQAPRDRFLLGVTATPNRTDAIGLGCVFQSIVYSYDLKQAIEDGWLVPPQPWVIETAESLDDVRISHGEFNQKDLAESVNTPARNQLAVEAWALHAKGRPTLGFTVDVAHAHDLADTFRRYGYRWQALSGETPREERQQLLAQIQNGQLDGIANCMVLTEGTDLPVVSCILHAKPTKSATLYEQMTGRGLRIHPGKKDCVVLDLVDIARKHSLQTAPVLYGLPPGLKLAGDDLRKVEAALDEIREKWRGPDLDELLRSGRYSLEELRRRSSTFDLWQVPSLGAFGEGRTLNWIKVATDTFRLSYPWADGTETVQISPDLLGKWEVVCTLRPRGEPGKARPASRQRTIAAGILTDRDAGNIAEGFITMERGSVAKMKAADAPWRNDPATDKQKLLLAKWRVPHRPDITKGEASALLDLAGSRRGAGR